DCLRPSSSNRGEDSIALIVEPTMVQPVPELRAISRRALTTSVPTLDRILGSFDAGKVTLIDSGSDFVFHLTTLLCVRAVMEGHEVVFLDGGNSVDPHGMVALGKRAGLTREEILPRVHVARAFTCHQMTTLILDMLDKKSRRRRPVSSSSPASRQCTWTRTSSCARPTSCSSGPCARPARRSESGRSSDS